MSPTPPEQARILLENLVRVGLLQKHLGPQGQEFYCFTAHMAPSHHLESLVEAGVLERTERQGQECYCLTAPLAPPSRPSSGRGRP